MVSKKIWFMASAVVLIVIAGILLFKFSSSQSMEWPGEDAAQFATDSDVRSHR